MRKTYLPLSDEDRDYLKALSKKRTIQAQVVDRARILLYKADGMTFQQIADKLAISTATVRLCISKFQKGGLDAALFDVQRPGRPSEITDDAKAWMIQYCVSETDRTRLCTGIVDVDLSPQIHSETCRRSGISKAFNRYQTVYPEIS